MASATVTTSGITSINSPIIPGNNISGIKAAIVVSTDEVTGAITSFRASMAARVASTPFCKRTFMDSTTTIASSTSIPRAITIPSKTALFRLCPMACSNQKVPARVKGIPMVVKKAMREPRNSQVTSSTRVRPIRALFCMILMALRVILVLSSSSTIFIPVTDDSRFFSAINCFKSAIICRVLTLSFLKTDSIMAG